MFVSFTVARYSGLKTPMGLLSMMIFSILLPFQKNGPQFSKLMGSGKNGTFDVEPDLNQWAYLFVWENEQAFLNFKNKSLIFKYIENLSGLHFTLHLQPVQAHGLWDKKAPFGEKSGLSINENELVAVLTRASIKINKAADFWRNVPEVTKNFSQNEGLVYSIGIGEVPLFKQATLSIWQNEGNMKNFAYKKKEHAKVIQKTRSQAWYSEELFARFRIVGISGQVPFSI